MVLRLRKRRAPVSAERSKFLLKDVHTKFDMLHTVEQNSGVGHMEWYSPALPAVAKGVGEQHSKATSSLRSNFENAEWKTLLKELDDKSFDDIAQKAANHAGAVPSPLLKLMINRDPSLRRHPNIIKKSRWVGHAYLLEFN